MWLWILAAIAVVLVAVLWGLSLWLSWPLWIAIVVSVIACTGIAVLVVLKLIAKIRAESLEQALLSQGEAAAKRARPDLRAGIVELQEQMRGALSALKSSKLASRGGASALYTLPWYVFIGPSGAGKTTSIQESGLVFATGGASSGKKVRGTGGTRNCEWWFTSEAILLDTAGRYVSSDDDEAEWTAFLDTVKRFRPKRPLDGILVAISIEDILSGTDEALEGSAHAIRSRIDEMMSRLEMVLPVYVTFTKSDLIGGFVEFWDDLKKTQRGEPWGVTFALDDPRLDEPAAAFEEELDRLVSTLHARVLDRVSSERRPLLQGRIVQFPAEVAAIKGPLASFISHLFQANPLQENPLLRGIYFTSGTQQGRAIDRIVAGIAQALRIFDAPTQPAPDERKSYFVTQLLRGIVFGDRRLAGRSKKRLRVERISRIAIAASIGTASLLLLGGAVASFIRNRTLIEGAEQAGAQLALVQPAHHGFEDLPALDVALRNLRRLEELADQTFRWDFGFGMFAGDDLLPPLRALYLAKLQTQLTNPVADQLAIDVRRSGEVPAGGGGRFQQSFDGLKLYLLMAHPPLLSDKDHADVGYRDWASTQLLDRWLATLHTPTTDSSRRELLTPHVAYYLEHLAKGGVQPWSNDARIVERSRYRLRAERPEDRWYAELLDTAERTAAPVTRDSVFAKTGFSAFVRSSSQRRVPGAYTKKGWESVRAGLAAAPKQFVADRWVLDEGTGAGEAEVLKRYQHSLRSRYFQDFVEAWKGFIRDLDVQIPSTLVAAVDELNALCETPSGYEVLFAQLRENITLEDLDDSSLLDKGKKFLEKALDAGAPEGKKALPVEVELSQLIDFGDGPGGGGASGSKLKAYKALLQGIIGPLQKVRDSTNPADAQALGDQLDRAMSEIDGRLLTGMDPSLRLLLSPMLRNPILGSWGGAVSTESNALGTIWKSDVFALWSAKLAAKYPFAEGAPEDVPMTDFVDFFRPQSGVLWGFYEKNLAKHLDRSGKTFVLSKRFQSSADLQPDLLVFLEQAQALSQAIFGTGAELSVPFTFNLHSVGPDIAEITFQVDGQAQTYRNGPDQWMVTQWPAKEAKERGAQIRIGGANIKDKIAFDTDFGLFHLFRIGNLRPAGISAGEGTTLSAEWKLGGLGNQIVQMSVRPSRSPHPFTPGFFSKMKCPESIVASTKSLAAGSGRSP